MLVLKLFNNLDSLGIGELEPSTDLVEGTARVVMGVRGRQRGTRRLKRCSSCGQSNLLFRTLWIQIIYVSICL